MIFYYFQLHGYLVLGMQHLANNFAKNVKS